MKYNLNDIAVDKHNRRVLADIFEGALSVNGHSQDIPLIYYRGSVYIIPAILTETTSTLCGEVGNEETGNPISKISVDGANLLAEMEVPLNSEYTVIEDGVLKGIITHDVGDGGLTVGYGYFIEGGLNNTVEVKRLKDDYGIIVEEGKMVEIDKVANLYADSLGSYEVKADNYVDSIGFTPNQHEYDALVIQCYNAARYDVMDAFRDETLSDAEALEAALDRWYRKLSTWNLYGNGWTSRVENIINLYRHGDYTKTY